ncbi:UbiA prenyltransferase family-domain-containing protein [Globomyces pollinis-pini]|nr:UbiA prenyltransferase family-domain-containing protein [Globomyces pollinis-pini]
MIQKQLPSLNQLFKYHVRFNSSFLNNKLDLNKKEITQHKIIEKQVNAVETGWINRLPGKYKHYALLMRMDKPAGTWLLFLPCSWSILMAAYSIQLSILPTIYMITLFGTGSLLLRGAGCTINDLWDVEFDKKVERTKSRPLASGALTKFEALSCLALQLLLGLGILVQLNFYSIVLGACSLFLVVAYPLMKRITNWPQAFLGLTFNYGALLGSSAILGMTNWEVALPLYLGGVCWTLCYDTIYALQDIKDDKLIGVKSTAIHFGDQVKPYLTGFATLSIGFFSLAGYMNDQTLIYYLISIGGTSLHYFWQIYTLKVNDVKDCWSKFISNRNFGLIFMIGIVLDWMYQYFYGQDENLETKVE